MTTKPPPLSHRPLRVGRITISSSPFSGVWRLQDCRRGRYEDAGNDRIALTFAEALDHLRKLEARELEARTGLEPAA